MSAAPRPVARTIMHLEPGKKYLAQIGDLWRAQLLQPLRDFVVRHFCEDHGSSYEINFPFHKQHRTTPHTHNL